MATSTTMDTRIIEINGKRIASGSPSISAAPVDQQLDRDWAKSAFLIADNNLDNDVDVQNRYWSSASAKFTDTRMGGNLGINARPQFTRYSDIRSIGRLRSRSPVSLSNISGNHGMGRYYSEAIDDPAQTIYLRFGVPQFNSLTNFIARAFDPNLSSMARTGRGNSVLYSLGKIAGSAVTIAAFPALSVGILSMQAISSFFMRPTSKFYTMKPTMHLYWLTVNTLVNTLAVNRGVMPKTLAPPSQQRLGKPFELDAEYMNQLSSLMPDLFKEGSYIDVFSIANRTQRLANRMLRADTAALESGNFDTYTGYLRKEYLGNNSSATYLTNENGDMRLGVWLDKVASFLYYQEDTTSQIEVDPRVDGTTIDPNDPKSGQKQDPGFFQSIAENLDAEFDNGSMFATFKVNHTGSVSESFSNSVVESDLSQKLNSMSSQSRQARFAFAEGNVVGDTVNSIMSGISDLATGILDGVTMGFSKILPVLGGSGYIDIPKHWQSSTANLPRTSYTMKLISPYGNTMSQIMNIDIPLAMLLAGALPLSTGKQSYTSPFLCQLYDRGRCQVRLGMIESLSITRGTSTLGFNTKGNALALDVTFQIVDMSSIMHMPISPGKIFDADMTLDEDNILMDYLAVLAGQDIYSQIYAIPKAKLAAAKRIAQARKLTSSAYWASLFHEESTSGLFKYVTLGAFNAIEGTSRGNTIAASTTQ